MCSSDLQALGGAWQALTSHEAQGNALVRGELELWARQYESLRQQSLTARIAFNDAVASYNGAVAQFPACVLAWFFSFREARGL